MCLTGTPVNGVLRIFGFQGGALSSDFGRMVSDLEPNPPDPLPADGYNESGMVGPTGAEFSFAFEPCIDATDYVSVGFSHLASVEPPDDMTFSVDFASVTPPPPENFQPGAGQSSCFRLGPGRQNITALRWTYPALMSGYTVNITIDDVAFFDTANCSTGGTGGAAGRGGAAGAGGS
jgi:hypothetical protein